LDWVFYIKKIGRRTWLIGGAAAQNVFLAAFISCPVYPSKEMGAAAAALIFLIVAIF
jgi:hypothetical protein